MKHLNIKEYVAIEKEKLKSVSNIKLGIIDTVYPDGDGDNLSQIEHILDDFSELGWKATLYKVRNNETSCHDAIIRAINHNCTGIIARLPIREEVRFDPMMIPRKYDCGGVRIDSLVNPAMPQGIIDYLEACEFPFSGKTAVILGGYEITKPIGRILLDKDMTVSICHNKSDPSIVSGFLCDADLVVSATGRPRSIVRNQCMQAVVIDASIGGDFEEKPMFCSDTVWSISVPDGIELLTRLALLKNCAKLVEGN